MQRTVYEMLISDWISDVCVSVLRLVSVAYEQAVLAALGDAEQAMGDYRAGLVALRRYEQALEASQRSYGHARQRFAAGAIAGGELLAAERQLHEAQAAAVRAHTDRKSTRLNSSH